MLNSIKLGSVCQLHVLTGLHSSLDSRSQNIIKAPCAVKLLKLRPIPQTSSSSLLGSSAMKFILMVSTPKCYILSSLALFLASISFSGLTLSSETSHESHCGYILAAKSTENTIRSSRTCPVSLIPIPKATSSFIPQIQYQFSPETETDRLERTKRQLAVKWRLNIAGMGTRPIPGCGTNYHQSVQAIKAPLGAGQQL
jgi:hypothetical protein